MTPPRDPSVRELRDCGGCEGIGAATPVPISNRPGLPAIAYRVGTHTAFKRSLHAALSEARHPALRKLTTREDDDFAIALLDAWATVADVLTFYSERIANESYLRTASERRSVLELARAIGYELNPGVAASTPLAFTLEDAAGAPLETVVEPGTKVQSVPKPGELPQIFETIERLEARAEWNALRPAQSLAWAPHHGDRDLFLAGVATGLRPGDALLIVGDERKGNPGSERWDMRLVASVEPDADLDLTRVTWERGLGEVQPFVPPAAQNPEVYALRLRASLFGHSAPDWRTLPDTVRSRYVPTTTGSAAALNALLGPEWPNLRIAAISLPGSSGPGTGPGLYGEYFDDVNLTSPRLTRIDQNVSFNWGTGSPDLSLDPDTFSVRWTGKVAPAFSETYTFFTVSDDGVRLWVDGTPIIDNWTLHGATEDSGTIALQANRQYDIRLEYFENTGASVISLSWASPSQPKQVIPNERLQIPYEVHLASPFPQVLPDTWLVLASPSYEEIYEVVAADESSRQGYALASKTTRVRLRGENLDIFDDEVRSAVAYAESELLAVAERPLTTPVGGKTIVLDRLVDGPPPARALLVSGRRVRVRVAVAGLQLVSLDSRTSRGLSVGEELIVTAPPAGGTWQLLDATGLEGTVAASAGALELGPAAPDDPVVSERATLEEADSVATERTTLVLATDLGNLFDRRTVTIAANVSDSTHGEATSEVLGSGNAAVPFQRFRLRQSPLTYVPADTPSGGSSTLEVRVDEVRWEEVPSLYGRGPRERVYVTRIDDGGTASVEFGDGENGARPQTGQENVRAGYRKGTGGAGNLDADQLSLLLTRPLGVKSVTNPIAVTGGQDAQELADARDNAPLTVLTLDRAVSLRDYEDFARTFAGLAKASATWTWNVDRRGVFLTVAGIDGAAIAGDDPLRARLLSALAAAGDPHVPVVARSYRPVPFRLALTVDHDPAYEAERVRAAVEDALKASFSFAARGFGEPVTLSKVVAVVQPVPGVVAVDVDLLYRGPTPAFDSFLPAASPRPGEDADAAQGAELLVLDLRPGDVVVRP